MVVILPVIGGFTKAVLWAADTKAKLDKVEQIQLEQAELQNKIFDFTMNLWRVDPKVSRKWSEIPQRPTLTRDGDTVKFVSWCEFEGFDRLIRYEVRGDSVGKPHLFADTLFEYERPDSTD